MTQCAPLISHMGTLRSDMQWHGLLISACRDVLVNYWLCCLHLCNCRYVHALGWSQTIVETVDTVIKSITTRTQSEVQRHRRHAWPHARHTEVLLYNTRPRLLSHRYGVYSVCHSRLLPTISQMEKVHAITSNHFIMATYEGPLYKPLEFKSTCLIMVPMTLRFYLSSILKTPPPAGDPATRVRLMQGLPVPVIMLREIYIVLWSLPRSRKWSSEHEKRSYKETLAMFASCKSVECVATSKRNAVLE